MKKRYELIPGYLDGITGEFATLWMIQQQRSLIRNFHIRKNKNFFAKQNLKGDLEAIKYFGLTKTPWYKEKFSAIWNYPDEDFIYFDGKISNVSYGR